MPLTGSSDGSRAPRPARKPRRSVAASEVARAEQLFIDGVGREISDTWGRVSALAGRIFAALYLRGRPMDMDELSALLGRSKSNILVNLRTLVSLGLVSKTWVSGSRRDQYEVAADYGNVILRAFLRRLGDNLESNRRVVETTEQLLADIDSSEEPEVAAMRERVQTAARFYDSVGGAYRQLVQSIGFEADFVALIQTGAALAKSGLASDAEGHATKGRATGARDGSKAARRRRKTGR